MSPIAKAIFDVRYRIPPEVLNTVFATRLERWRDTPKNVEEEILALVVRPRVLFDCNLVGGTEFWIPLDGLAESGVMEYETVFRIPKSRTNGRSILSVLNISFNDPSRMGNTGTMAYGQGNSMLQAGAAVMDAMGAIPQTATSRVELIGENVVLVRDVMTMPSSAFLRCIVANDENMNNIQLRSYLKFCKLVEYAVKSYVYNFYIVQLDMGELRGGQTIGRIKDIIESYADAEENYETYLAGVWQKVAFMNDQESYTRHLRLLLGNNR